MLATNGERILHFAISLRASLPSVSSGMVVVFCGMAKKRRFARGCPVDKMMFANRRFFPKPPPQRCHPESRGGGMRDPHDTEMNNVKVLPVCGMRHEVLGKSALRSVP